MPTEYIVTFNEDERGIARSWDISGKITRCQNCEHFHEDVWGHEIGITGFYRDLIVGHNGCDKWHNGFDKDMIVTDPNGYCFLGEPKEDKDELD